MKRLQFSCWHARCYEHEGHHVEVSAHVYVDKTAINVMSVQMLKERTSRAQHSRAAKNRPCIYTDPFTA